MGIAGGFGLRNTIIGFAILNIVLIIIVAIINNLFPNIPFAEIITAYVNAFLTTVMLFLAGTVGFAQIVINVGLVILWVLLNFLWKILFDSAVPTFLITAPSFDFSNILALFLSIFVQILNQPLIFTPPIPLPDPVSLLIGGAVTTAVVLPPPPEPTPPLEEPALSPGELSRLRQEAGLN